MRRGRRFRSRSSAPLASAPVIARGASGPTPAADEHLEPGIFPSRLRHLVEDALTGRLSHAARIVIPRTSDADYKCFLYLREFVRRGVATALAPVVLFDLLQSRGADVPAPTTWRARARCSTSCASASGRTPSADDLRREIARANAARAAARRLVALRRIVPRVAGTEVFPLLAAFWEMEPDRYVEMASDAASSDRGAPAARPAHACCSPERLWMATTLHEAIESHGAVVVAEVGPWGSGAAGDDVRIDDDPVAALADKYRADAIGARTPVDVAAPLDGAHARRRRCRRRVAAAGRRGVRLGLSGAARRAAGASAFRTSVFAAIRTRRRPRRITQQLDAMVSAASRRQEARHG